MATAYQKNIDESIEIKECISYQLTDFIAHFQIKIFVIFWRQLKIIPYNLASFSVISLLSYPLEDYDFLPPRLPATPT